MKNLLLNFSDWRERLCREPLAVFLDFDGTLAEIAPSPDEASLPYSTKEILKAFVKLKGVKVAIISGRALSEIKRKVPVRGLSFVGSHGFEFSVRGLNPRPVEGKYLQALREVKEELKRELRDLPGILMEEKPFSLAIHYRKASPVVEDKVKRAVVDICDPAVNEDKLIVISGKKVVEIMPSQAMNKGRAVRRLLRLWCKGKCVPVYIGDDRTDESAFEAVRDAGLTIKVGLAGERSKAEYYLGSVDDVRNLLRMILYFRGSNRL